MWSYAAPLRDMQFVIEDVLQAPSAWAGRPAHADLDADTARQVLEEAGKFAGGVLAPLNGPGDLAGCRWEDGRVTTPPGFADAYRALVDGGWPALACDPDWGGQGLPHLLDAALQEMLAASNHAFTMYPGLLHGAYACLRAHGSPALRERYLARIVSGEWLSTMALTEPQAGSDLALIRTRAEPVGDDGLHRVSGSKIFISGGEQDLTDNIVHLVLARRPDAAPGTRGLSLFLVPKVLPDGRRNGVRCDGIEKKMGIKGSATCAMSFEAAEGWLVGEPGQGLSAMFVMMNAARLHVGLQGLGHLEMAGQNAWRYAAERVQGQGRPIAAHPAMRRILWGLRAMAEGERVIAYWTAHTLDDAEHHPHAQRRERADDLVSLLTPVVKAFCTDNGFRGASEALQVWGGYGYVHEYGIEQTLRDSRIAMIYEGTNQIQALDLVRRKLGGDGGRRLAALLEAFDAEVAAAGDDAALAPFARALAGQARAWRERPELGARAADVADDVLRVLGYSLLAWAWARTARACRGREGDPWIDDKRRAAQFGIDWLLPEADAAWVRIRHAAAVLP